MESPEKRLQEQAAIARAVRAEQKIAPTSPATDGTVVDFDADIGRDVIQLSDGSIRYATPMASGVRGAGDTVLVHQSGVAYSDSLQHIKKRVSGRLRKVPQVTYPLKVLFSVVEEGVHNFYLGGDRIVPEKVFSIDSSIAIEAWVTNTGKKKTDWIVTVKYENTIKVISNPSDWTLTSAESASLNHIGVGFFSGATYSALNYLYRILQEAKDVSGNGTTTIYPTNLAAYLAVYDVIYGNSGAGEASARLSITKNTSMGSEKVEITGQQIEEQTQAFTLQPQLGIESGIKITKSELTISAVNRSVYAYDGSLNFIASDVFNYTHSYFRSVNIDTAEIIETANMNLEESLPVAVSLNLIRNNTRKINGSTVPSPPFIQGGIEESFAAPIANNAQTVEYYPILTDLSVSRSLCKKITQSSNDILDKVILISPDSEKVLGDYSDFSEFFNFNAKNANWIEDKIYVSPLETSYAFNNQKKVEIKICNVNSFFDEPEITEITVLSLKIKQTANYRIHSASFFSANT